MDRQTGSVTDVLGNCEVFKTLVRRGRGCFGAFSGGASAPERLPRRATKRERAPADSPPPSPKSPKIARLATSPPKPPR